MLKYFGVNVLWNSFLSQPQNSATISKCILVTDVTFFVGGVVNLCFYS